MDRTIEERNCEHRFGMQFREWSGFFKFYRMVRACRRCGTKLVLFVG